MNEGDRQAEASRAQKDLALHKLTKWEVYVCNTDAHAIQRYNSRFALL